MLLQLMWLFLMRVCLKICFKNFPVDSWKRDACPKAYEPLIQVKQFSQSTKNIIIVFAR